MDPQKADIHVLGKHLFALPMSKTDVGVWAGLDAPKSGDLTADDAAIGELVDRALDASRTELPHPQRDRLSHLLDPLLEMTGLQHASDLHRETGLVSVERQRGSYRVVRMAKVVEKGSRRSWFGEDALVRDLVEPSAEALGAVVRELASAPDSVRAESRAR